MINDLMLGLLALVAKSSSPLSATAQQEMCAIASSSKSLAGDGVLQALAVRADLCTEVRMAVEKSSRASVKAAWLSRNDHTKEYLEKAIASESRVTVLAAVAAQASASDTLVEALARVRSVKVAKAVLTRETATDRAQVEAAITLFGGDGVSYELSNTLDDLLASSPEKVTAIAQGVSGKIAAQALLQRLHTVGDRGLPAAELQRLALMAVAGWEEELSGQRGPLRWSSPVWSYTHTVNAAVEHPSWDTSSDADRELAPLIRKLETFGASLSGAAELCRLRHLGTDAELKSVKAAAERQRKLIERARCERNPKELAKLLENDSEAVKQALCDNPHITLEQAAEAAAAHYNQTIVLSRLRHGESPERVAAALLLTSGLSVAELPEPFSGAGAALDRVEVGKHVALLASACSAHFWPMAYIASGSGSEVLKGMVPHMTLSDVALLAVGSYHVDESQKQVLADVLAWHLNEGLGDAEAWQTFASLAGDSDVSLLDTVAMCSSL